MSTNLQNYRKWFMVFALVLMLIGFQANQVSANQLSQTVTGNVVIVQPVPSEINGEGSIGEKTHFEFDVKSSKGIITGHLEYTDGISKIMLESNKMIFLSVTPSTASFLGTDILNKQTVTFQVNVQANHQSCQNDFFSIIIKNSSGQVIYQKSGYLTSGDIDIQSNTSKNDSDHKCKTNGHGEIGKDMKFDVGVERANSMPSGNLKYQDKSAKIDLTSTSITSFSETSATTATILGVAKINDNTGYKFEISLVGNQKPTTHDLFVIIIYDKTGNEIYSKLGKLTSGDIIIQ